MKKKAVSGTMLTLLFVGMLTLASNIQQAESLEPPAIEWSKTYGGSESDIAECVVQTNDGGYAMTGGTWSFGNGKSDFWLVRTDSNGVMLWSKTYGGADRELASSVIQTDDGGYAMTGKTESFGNAGFDLWLVKTDSAGNTEWDKTFGGANSDEAQCIIQTSDGGYTISGSTLSFGAGRQDFWLMRTDSSRNKLWSKTYGGSDSDLACSMIQTVEGGYAMIGITYSFGYDDIWLVKTDMSGNKLWSKTYGGNESEHGYSIVQTDDGGYAILGLTGFYESIDALLVKTDVSGNMQWNMTCGQLSSGDYPLCLIKTSDSEVAFAGHVSSKFWLAKIHVPVDISDMTFPTISVLSPENETYVGTEVLLTFLVNEQTSWTGFSLDEQANETTAGNRTLFELSDGLHQLIAYAMDMSGNIGSSETVYFTIETQQPEPEPTVPWQPWITVAVVAIAVVGTSLLVYFLKKRKLPTLTAPTTPEEEVS